MLRLIETFGEVESTVEIGGQTFPSVALIEDDMTTRYGLIHGPRLSVTLWVRLDAAGAWALAYPDNDGWRVMTTDKFMARRKSAVVADKDVFEVPEVEWAWFDHFPLFDEISEPQGFLREGFVHLHAHSEMSPLDGLSTIEEMVGKVIEDGQPALAITDHGVCAGHPMLAKAVKDTGIKPIFGIEANFTDDRLKRPSNPEERRFVLGDYRHLVLWAMDDRGLRNLWAMNTEANRTGFYGRPRMDWEVIREFNEGVMASTACLRGPLSRHILEDDEDGARATLGRLLDIFGDRLYVELHTNSLDDQRKVNHALVGLAREFSLPTIAAVDSHYCRADHKDHHEVWIASQTNKDLTDEKDLFSGDSDYHMMTEAEVRQALTRQGLSQSVIDEAVSQTVAVADRCDAMPRGSQHMPVYSKKGGPSEDVRRLVDKCIGNWHRCVGRKHPEQVYEERFDMEMKLLVDKGFCGYFLMVSEYCSWAREHGILVGPGRGSGSGSLVAYLSDITAIDPIEADLLFERFLTEGRKALPDFDVDFPATKRGELTDHIVSKYGEDSVVRVGTHIRLKNKGVVRDMARVLKKTIDVAYMDIEKVSAIIDEAESDKAGLGMPWEELWDQHGDVLDVYREKYPLLFKHADALVGRLKTYGKHAAGLVIAPDMNLAQSLPLRRAGKDDVEGLIAEFDLESLEELGLVKFDILTLRTLDTIQMCVDLIREDRGDVIDIYSWRDEYEDPYVWEQISEGHTLGLFQVETPGGTRAITRFQPHSLDELSDVITLVRPGPMRSGLTDLYYRRKMGQEGVSYLDPRLEPILKKTYGAMIYQEQVMQTCMVLAGYTSNEADDVRKLLGKKQVEKVEEAGKQFKARCAERQVPAEVATVLWNQMAEFARYSFNRSHAYAYAMLAYWTAWLKFHYPVQFITAALTTLAAADKTRLPEFVQEARRMGLAILPPDVNLSKRSFKAEGLGIRYGLQGLKGLGQGPVESIIAGQPYESLEDFIERRGKVNFGAIRILGEVGGFDSLVPNRKAALDYIEWFAADGTGDPKKLCYWRDDSVSLGENALPCTFDWSTEPLVIGKRGKPLKPKPLPKKCTRACRNWTAPTPPPLDGEGFSRQEVMDLERTHLGLSLTHTPFDGLPDWLWDEGVVKGSVVEKAPPGEFLVVGMVSRLRPHMASNGPMGFITLEAVDADVDVAVFNETWAKYERDLRLGSLYVMHIKKTDRGQNLVSLQPI